MYYAYYIAVQPRLRQVRKFLLYAPPTDESRRDMEMLLRMSLSLPSSLPSSVTGTTETNGEEDDDASSLASSWTLIPMMMQQQNQQQQKAPDDDDDGSTASRNAANNNALTASNLSPQLTDALTRVRENVMTTPRRRRRRTEHRETQQQQKDGTHESSSPSSPRDDGDGPVVVFIGMDSPELPLDELVVATATTTAAEGTAATLCPAADGGYGMVSIPACVDARRAFRGVRWSHPLTAASQIKALTDCNVPVKLGQLMYDIDEPEDVLDLCRRLAAASTTTAPKNRTEEANDDYDVLSYPSAATAAAMAAAATRCADNVVATNTAATNTGARASFCRHTRHALIELGQLKV